MRRIVKAPLTSPLGRYLDLFYNGVLYKVILQTVITVLCCRSLTNNSANLVALVFHVTVSSQNKRFCQLNTGSRYSVCTLTCNGE